MLSRFMELTRPRRLLSLGMLALIVAGATLGGALTASAQTIDVNGTQPVATSFVPGSNVVAVNASVPMAASSYVAPVPATSYVAPVPATSYIAPAATTYTTTAVMTPAPTYASSGGSYCQMPDGGQVFVNAGSSPAVYGC